MFEHLSLQCLEIPDILAHVSDLRRKGRHQESILCLTRSLVHRPENGTLQHALSVSHRLAGNFDESIRWSEVILSRQPNNPFALLARIEAARLAGKLDTALAWVEEAAERCPDHLPLQVGKGRLLRQAGQPEAGVAYLTSLAETYPENTSVLHELVLSMSAAGKATACLGVCEKLLRAGSQNAQIRLIQIASLARLMRYETALVLLEGFIQDYPNNLPSRLRKADLFRKLGRNREAISLLIALRSAHPSSMPVSAALATCLRAAGDYMVALKLLDNMLVINPADSTALLNRIEIFQQLNDQSALVAALHSASQQLNNSVISSEQTLFSSVICKGIVWVDMPVAEQLLKRHTDRLIELAPTLPPQFLWRAYSVSDRLGMNCLSKALAKALLSLDEIDITTARSIVTVCFRAGLKNWKGIAARLVDSVSPDDRNTLLIKFESLHGLPSVALSNRKFPHSLPRPARVMLIVRLLKQQGRIRIAARYLGLVRRSFGHEPALMQEHVFCLCGSGQADAARRILTEAEQTKDMPLLWREALAAGWAELNELNRAVKLLDETPFHRAIRNDWYVANILAGANRDRAAQLARDLREQTTDAHFATSIRAMLLAEGTWHATQEVGELILPAIRCLNDWVTKPTSASGYASAPPKRIMQYWSQGRPPVSVMAAVESWQQAGGFQHHLFDRRAARTFLHDRLGLDWRRAFGRTASPTEECDFFRLCYLAVEGGIYADCDDWLTGDAAEILGDAPVMTLYREPTGALGNNIIAAPPRHLAIMWAAVAAKHALLDRHNDNTWAKTGPGLLTRAAAWHIARSKAVAQQPALRILPRWMLGGIVQYHSPMGYKFGSGYWNRAGAVGRMQHFAAWRPSGTTSD